MSGTTTANVLQLKESLLKSTDHVERLLDILDRLDEANVDLKVLADTLVGTSVSKLKSHDNPDVASKAKSLVKKWKKLAKEGGVAPASATAAASSTSSVASSSTSSSAAKLSSTTAHNDNDDNDNAEAEAEWSHLPPLRKNISSKLHSIFLLSKAEMTKGEGGLDPKAISSLCISRASEVEHAIQTFSKNDANAYKDKARSIVFNTKKNTSLRDQVLLGRISGTELIRMSPEDLATSEKVAQRAKLISDLQDSRRLDWETANEDKINKQCGIKGDLLKASLFTCGRCKSIKTTSTQKQTRSADEPMTVFVLCLNCGNRWKFS